MGCNLRALNYAPVQILRFVILFACIVVTIYQLAGCILKLKHPPISTHSRIAFNKTMTYPAITICQSPPYKEEILKKYGLPADISLTSAWSKFPWGNVSLLDFWEEATFSFQESVSLFGISGNQKRMSISSSEVVVKSEFYFINGRCFTFTPLVGTTRASRNSGWSFLLKHGANISSSEEDIDVGWNVHIHDSAQPWTENPDQTDGLMEHLFLETGTELHLKTEACMMRNIPHSDMMCSYNTSITTAQCVENCRWRNFTKKIGCSAPWLPEIHLPFCDNFEDYNTLLQEYMKFDKNKPTKCGCMNPCNIDLYETYALARKPITQRFSRLYVFFTSKLVSVLEELPGYDWTMFVADLGGSLGFLLGLSVLSVITIIEQMIGVVMTTVNNDIDEDSSTISADETKDDIATIDMKFQELLEDDTYQKYLKTMQKSY